MRDNLKVLCGFFMDAKVLPRQASRVSPSADRLGNLHINLRLIKLSEHLQHLLAELWLLHAQSAK